MKSRLVRHMGIALFIACAGWAAGSEDRDRLMQVSVIDALLAGDYDGHMRCGELLLHGDFGIGTFDRLDGEMTVLDGVVYAIRSDGRVEKPSADETTPFATVTMFDEDLAVEFDGPPLSYEAFQDLLKGRLSTPNHFYAVRVDGRFSRMKTRSVPRQEPPYPPLAEVAARQSVFEMEQVEGTLVGFWSPPFVKGVNVPGWHFHFLDAGRSAGGHVLDFEMVSGRGALDRTPRVFVWLPEQGGFLGADLAPDRGAELHAVEQDTDR